MAAKKNTTNGNGHSNGHVSLSREEYAAFLGREEVIANVSSEHDRVKSINYELATIVDAQAKRLTESELKIGHLERVAGLQLKLIDMLRDGTNVAEMGDLSEFWRQWQIYMHAHKDDHKNAGVQETINKIEPNLFKTWSNWVKDAGRADRMLSEAGSRAEQEKLMPKNTFEMQEHIITRLRRQVANLTNQARALEVEIESRGPQLTR